MNDWNALRNEFPVTNKYVYFNHAAVSPLSRRVSRAMRDFIEDATLNGAVNSQSWHTNVEECRKLCARLINADSTEIAFMKNTTQGLIVAANGINWQNGDNVITVDVEFPANVYPWMNLAQFGVSTRMVKEQNGRIPLESIESMIDKRTKAIAISYVEFASGFRNDLKAIGEICRDKNLWFIVDAIQGLGALELDVKACNIDILACDGHKWIMGPEGAALFYCSKEKIEQLTNTNVGWRSVINSSNYLNYVLTLKPDARRFEEGGYNMVGLIGLKAALELLLEIGISKIEDRVMKITDLLINKLQSKGYRIVSSLMPKERSGIVSFASDKYSSAELCQLLRENNVIVSNRSNAVRVSPHFYNNEEENNILIELLP